MKKRILAMFVTVIMIASVFTACSSNPEPAKNDTTKKTEKTETTKKSDSGETKTETKKDTTSSTVEANVVEEVKVEVKGYGEAPALAAQVKSGALAKVEDRIPDLDNVFVETNAANGKALEIGNYGGEINILNGGGGWDVSRPILETIIHYNTDGTYYPNVIKSYEYTDDYKVWTFNLREGMKWSDGYDFTADDITFWYYMCHLNNFDTKKSWTALKESDGSDNWAVLKKIDDYTVTWTFQQAKFPADFIENGDFKWCWAPAHFFADIIPSSFYVANEYWKDTGLSDEQALANAKAKHIDQASIKDVGKQGVYYFWNIPGMPTLNPYIMPETSSRNDDLCILERNPYYWKVDAKGNQLPYCDKINLIRTSADGQDQLMFRSGELDLINIDMEDISGILADMGAKAELRQFASTDWGSCQVTFNYTCTDKKYADLFANSKFRQAISICVDRDQVSELLSNGFLEPGQCSPAEGNFGYDEAWSKKWTEYDAVQAKKLLEECGLKMGADGYYDFADGTDLVIEFYTYTESGNTNSYPVLEQYFKAAGINCANKDMAVAAFDTYIDNNDWYAVLGPHTSIGGLSLKSRVAPFVPVAQAAEWYGEYGTYYQTNGAQGVRPVGDFEKLVQLYGQWVETPDSARRDKIALEIYKVHQENLWTIAYMRSAGSYYVVNSKLKNYPDNLVWDDLYMYGNIIHYWTMYKVD